MRAFTIVQAHDKLAGLKFVCDIWNNGVSAVEGFMVMYESIEILCINTLTDKLFTTVKDRLLSRVPLP